MIEVKILSVDKDKKRVSLGIKQLTGDPWKKRDTGEIPCW
jgi:ribosomal protein S1